MQRKQKSKKKQRRKWRISKGFFATLHSFYFFVFFFFAVLNYISLVHLAKKVSMLWKVRKTEKKWNTRSVATTTKSIDDDDRRVMSHNVFAFMSTYYTYMPWYAYPTKGPRYIFLFLLLSSYQAVTGADSLAIDQTDDQLTEISYTHTHSS